MASYAAPASCEPTRNRASLVPVAPVIAKHRERAGRVKGAQRRSGPLTRLSAPKNRESERPQTRTRSPRNLNRSACGNRRQQRSCSCPFVPGENLALTSVRILGQYSHAHGARPSTSSTLTWGRERPRRSALGPGAQHVGGVAHAPSLLETPVLGRLPGGTNRRPPGSARPASTSAPSVDCGASMTAVAPESRASREESPSRRRGPTAPWPCVSLLGPPCRRRNRHGDDDGRVSASP